MVENRTRAPRTEAVQALIAAGFIDPDEAAAAALSSEVETVVIEDGETLMTEGEPGDAMYLVISGRLRAFARRAGVEQAVGEIGRGEVVGELALLSDAPRAATVRAIRDAELARLSRAGFERLAQSHPAAVLNMTRLIVQRLQRLLHTPRAAETIAAIAVVPLHAGAPAAAFARRLHGALAAFGSCQLWDAAGFERDFGQPGAAQTPVDDLLDPAIVVWLGDRESEHTYLIYLADADWSPWSQRCLRQADRILLLAEADANPEPGEVERRLAEKPNHARVELVLLHPATAAQPTGTAAWLEKRPYLHTHHHLRLDDERDLRRLARRLTGRAVGLVLGGGAARGFAHIGVIRALEEAGIEIDLFGGASIGALIAGPAAMNWDGARLQQAAELLGSTKKIFDRTLPLTAMMESKKVTQIVRQVFGDRRIEDLWQPFFCMASNLTRARPVVIQRGLLWEAVRASIAIPGIFTPILREGEVMIDGGVMNNLPIDVMRRQFEAGKVIAVDASPAKTKLPHYDFGPSISGWRLLWGRILPWVRPLRAPSLIGSMLRAIELNSAFAVEHDLAAQADLLIRPALENFNALDWDAYAAIIEAGYKAGREQANGWRAGEG
jgi:predicted acylesterase/phospholipase RssA/CRP-like cAMP-binding protein